MIIALVLINIHSQFQRNLAIGNLLLIFNTAFVLCFQAKLAFDLCKRLANTSWIYKINVLVPAVFFSLYFINVTYHSFAQEVFFTSHRSVGAMRMPHWRPGGWVIFGFLIHGFVTFVFITNRYADVKVNTIADPEQKAVLQNEHVQPMHLLVNTSAWLFALGFAAMVVVEIIKVAMMK